MSDEGDEKKSPTTQTEEKSNAADTQKQESSAVKSPVKDASAKKSGDASPAKSKSTPKKDADKSEEEEGDGKSGEESDDDEAPSDNKHWSYVAVGSDDEESTAILEQPLEVSGKRDKKKVERLQSQLSSPKEQIPLEIRAGPGVKLGDIPFIEFQLSRTLASDLKTLHHVVFTKKQVKLSQTKKNLRQFSGEPDGKESVEHTKRMAIINRLGLGQVKGVCTLLGVEKKGTKSDQVDRLETFLLKPEDSGKTPEKKKPKSKKRSISKTKSKKSDKEKKEKKDKKKEKSDADDDNVDDDDDDDEEAEEDQDNNEEEDSDTEAPPPKKKAKVEKKTPIKEKKTPTKEKKKLAEKKKKPTPKKSSPKKTPKQNGKNTSTKSKDADMSDLSSDSDDEPLSKLKEPSPPDNAEIKKFVKKTLEGADLEEVTMKTVVKKVYAKYPSFDLSDRKDFIKSVVRQIIS